VLTAKATARLRELLDQFRARRKPVRIPIIIEQDQDGKLSVEIQPPKEYFQDGL
jgi:hypothetical protein